MRPGERVDLIKECATLLSTRGWAELDLVLRGHSLPWTDNWRGSGEDDGRYDYVIEMLSGGRGDSDDLLQELHAYLTRDSGAGVVGSQPWPDGNLKLAISHLATHGEFASNMNYVLSRYGVHGFVAHTSIEPSEEWQNVIESALATCDAMVVLLHQGFQSSDWCDQEVGYALAKRVPVLPVAIDLMPYGFLGKVQAYKAGDKTAPQIAAHVIEWLASKPSAHSALTEGLVTALVGSRSYDQSRAVFQLLQRMPSLTPAQMERLGQAHANPQVGDANLAGIMLPDLIRKLLLDRGGAQVPTPTWADEPPF